VLEAADPADALLPVAEDSVRARRRSLRAQGQAPRSKLLEQCKVDKLNEKLTNKYDIRSELMKEIVVRKWSERTSRSPYNEPNRRCATLSCGSSPTLGRRLSPKTSRSSFASQVGRMSTPAHNPHNPTVSGTAPETDIRQSLSNYHQRRIEVLLLCQCYQKPDPCHHFPEGHPYRKIVISHPGLWSLSRAGRMSCWARRSG